MCQEKPGPRCAGHTAVAVATARTREVEAQDALDRAQAAANADTTTPRNASTPALNALATARRDLAAAQAAHQEAVAEHETTPTGQEELRARIQELRNAGDRDAAEQVQALLTTRQEQRAQQVKDLNAAREQRARLAAATPDEVAAMDQADAAVRDAAELVSANESAVRAATERTATLRPEYDSSQRQYSEALSAVRPAEEAAEKAANTAAREARRIYLAAGVNERMVAFYIQDMVDGARDKHPTSTLSSGPIGKALRMKVKRTGADRDATVAAAEAAKTDLMFKTSNSYLSGMVAKRREAEQVAREIRRNDVEPIAAQWTQATRDAMNAKYALEDARNAHSKTVTEANILKARVGAGMGPSGASVPLSRARDEIVRNPDGTTNAYLYRAPSPGFPHGRMTAAVDVSTSHGWSPANALVLEDGTTVTASEHHFRNTRGAQTARSDAQVYLAPAQEGATPLRSENHATAGFATFIDSTD